MNKFTCLMILMVSTCFDHVSPCFFPFLFCEFSQSDDATNPAPCFTTGGSLENATDVTVDESQIQDIVLDIAQAGARASDGQAVNFQPGLEIWGFPESFGVPLVMHFFMGLSIGIHPAMGVPLDYGNPHIMTFI